MSIRQQARSAAVPAACPRGRARRRRFYFSGPCEPGCPAAAIFPNTVPGNASWLELNARYASVWPNITVKRSPPADANAFDGLPNKFERYFSETPGRGD